MKRRPVLASSLVAAVFTLTGCASTSSTAATGAQQSAYGVDTAGEGPTAAVATDTPAAAPSAEPSAEPSSGPCLTHACVVSDLDQGLTGLIAADESVTTKVTCYKKTVVFHKAADTYSASCTVEYSDGSSAYGTGNLLVKQQKVTFSAAD